MPRSSKPVSLRARAAGPATVVTVAASRLTGENAGKLGEQVAALLGGRLSLQLHLDLAQVEMLTGIPLGELIALNQRVRQAGGRLVVDNVSPLVGDVLRLSRVDRLFEVRHQAA